MLPCSIGPVKGSYNWISIPEIPMKPIRRHAALAALLLALAPLAARAEWPDRPIKWVVPFTAGGANDLIARAAAEGVAKRLKQPVVIENKPGAGTAGGSEYGAKPKGEG